MRFTDNARCLKACLLACLFTVYTIPAYADNQPPSVINGVTVTAIGDTTVRVTWHKPWDDVGVYGYNVYRNGSYYATTFDTNFVDRDVAANSEYRYGVVGFDRAKNFSTISSEVTVATGGSNEAAPPPPAPAPANNAAVNRPEGLFAEIQNGNEAIIKWRAPAGDIKGYNVFRNGGYMASVASPEYRDQSMNWGEDYNYMVIAYNQTDTFSEKSDILTVNTANGSSSTTDNSNTTSVESVNEQRSVPQDDAISANSSVPDGYNLVFSDEFNSYSLDTSKWNSSYRWGPGWIINGEKQYYVDRINNPDFGHSPFEFDGNHMTISAIRTPDHLRSSANWQPYLSGALTTYNKFKMRYGYVEMRAKLPKGRGLWSAFWLLHQNDNDRRPEIDVMEYIGDKPNTIYNTYHYYENWNLRSTPSYEVPGEDFSQNFHTYGMRWEPGKITWYVDGVERNVHNDGNVSWEDMYLLVNLAVGGWWPGDPDGNTSFPARYQIDYIRAYQKN